MILLYTFLIMDVKLNEDFGDFWILKRVVFFHDKYSSRTKFKKKTQKHLLGFSGIWKAIVIGSMVYQFPIS